MAEAAEVAKAPRQPAGSTCPVCGVAFRALPEPKRRKLRADPRSLLGLCPRCRRREAAQRMARTTESA